MHKIGFRNSTLNILIKMYLQSSLTPSIHLMKCFLQLAHHTELLDRLKNQQLYLKMSRITYENREPVTTAKQFFWTTWPYCNIEFIEFFDFESVSSHTQCIRNIFILIVFCYLISTLVFSSLHDEDFDADEKILVLRLD